MVEPIAIGDGDSVFPSRTVTGSARWFETPADVVLADIDQLHETVAFVRQPGVAFLAPILGHLRGVVCTIGSVNSHLALVALQYGLPCIMGADLREPVEDGTQVELEMHADRRGRILVAGSPSSI